MSEMNISRALRRLRHADRRMKKNPEFWPARNAAIVDSYDSGATVAQIAEIVDEPAETIRELLADVGR